MAQTSLMSNFFTVAPFLALTLCYIGVMIVYQYPKCSTCRNALKWLEGHHIAHDKIDLVAAPPPLPTLRDLWQRSGLPLAKFFNTSGESYRAGGFKERLPKMSEADALAALAKDGKLIKRPIVDAGKKVLVGFDADTYKKALA